MEKCIFDESNGLWYELQGDYYIPCLTVPAEEEKPIGIWGQRHLRYIKAAMMNINLIYFAAGTFMCLFVADDFRGGYAKNLFTVQAKKGKYVAAKTVAGILAGALMLIAFFVGTVLGGSFAGLSFSLGEATILNLALCMIAKVLLMGVMVPIFLAVSAFGKGRSWLSILLSLFIGMLLFMIIPLMTPLTTGPMNVILCAAGAVMFTAALGVASRAILSRSDLV